MVIESGHYDRETQVLILRAEDKTNLVLKMELVEIHSEKSAIKSFEFEGRTYTATRPDWGLQESRCWYSDVDDMKAAGGGYYQYGYYGFYTADGKFSSGEHTFDFNFGRILFYK